MSVNFIIGPAGSGKTKHIVDCIAGELAEGEGDNPSNIILLVPDQATFLMERKVLENPAIDGFMRLHVLSFRRLCYRIIEETGGLFHPFLTAVGKSMAVQSVLWENKDNLTVFAPLVGSPGFRNSLSRVFSELGAYNVSPSDIKEGLGLGDENAVPFLNQKVCDLDVLYTGYREFLRGRFVDPDDYLTLGAEKAHLSNLVNRSSVWIDGFSGFTPGEYSVLSKLMQHAQKVNIGLCMDKREAFSPLKETSPFYTTHVTMDRLKQRAYEAGLSPTYLFLTERPPLLRYRASPELSFLEGALRARLRGEDSGKASFQKESPPGLRLLAAVSPRAEVEFVAREIVRLVRDCHLRYRDIIVVGRDLEEYGDALGLVFNDFSIPYFLDDRKPMSFHPLSELLRAAFDVVTTSFKSEAVFRYLKTDMVGTVGRGEVDQLENYVLAHGITGKTWISEEPWRYTPGYFVHEDADPSKDESAHAEGIRRKALAHLSHFYHRLTQQEQLTAQQIGSAVYDLLVDLDVPRRLEEWQKQAEDEGDLSFALLCGGLWDKTLEILEQAEEILGDTLCSVKAYADLVQAGLEDIRLGTIPPSLDQVMVGSLDRSRQPDCKVAFLVGARAGSLPKKQSEDSIFSDREREYLALRGVELEPGSYVKQIHEGYLVYIALTRPEQTLYVSYPLCDEEGSAVVPSYVINMVSELLGGKEIETVTLDPPGILPQDLHFVVGPRVLGTAVKRLAGARHGQWPGDVWFEVFRWLCQPERLRSSLPVFSSLKFTNKMQPLDEGTVRGLYGHTLITSVSRLERFAACPFYHFAQDGLGLKERDIFKLEPADAGTFLHAVLKGVADDIKSRGVPWGSLADDEVLSVVGGVADGLLDGPQGDLFRSSARLKYAAGALRKIAERSALVLTEHERRGDFTPVAAELSFGPGKQISPFTVQLPGGQQVLLRGQIDRVDAGVKDDCLFLRIIDYKSSPKTLDPSSIYHGLSLQLMVYLMVALDSWPQILGKEGVPLSGIKTVVPAGALYFALRDPVESVPSKPVDFDVGILKGMRMTGLLNSDAQLLRMMDPLSTGHSDIIPVQFTKSGGVGGISQVAPVEDLRAVLDFVGKKVREFSSLIFSGNLDVAPFRKGTVRACTYCPFGPLCTFDILTPGNRYRNVGNVDKTEAWNLIRKG